MDKLAAIRIYDGQNYSDEIPVTALAENIQWDESSTLIDILGSINLTRKGNIQDQIDELNNRINQETYSKPIDGIPKTDLANSVQISLGKADTALQSYTETDPTVPAWAKQPNKPTYTAQEVGALPADSQITVEVDDTLSIQGAAADAKAVGDALDSISTSVQNIWTGRCTDRFPTTTINKTIVLDNPEGFSLVNGVIIAVKYIGNVETVSNPCLNVNGTGNIPVIAGDDSSFGNDKYYLRSWGDQGLHFFTYRALGNNPGKWYLTNIDTKMWINLIDDFSILQDANVATAQDLGKVPTVKVIRGGQVTEWQYKDITIDNTLNIQGAPADAKKVGNELVQIKQDLEIQQTRAETAQALKINKPVTNPNGTQGQILQTDGQGGTSWVNKQTDEQIADAVTDWLDDHVTPGGSTIVVDDTLSIQGAAADAKKTGDEIATVKDGLSSVENNILTNNIRQALLQIAEKIAYIDADGQDYYDDLYDALYPSAVSISAVYTQTGTVYTTDALNSLKDDLVVTAVYGDSTTRTLSPSDYTLSGTLTAGTSTIYVHYGNLTTTFNVTVTARTLYSISAVYTQSGTVYSDDNLNLLKSDLVVTATYSDATTEVLNNSDYTLSGSLDSGTSTVTVTYSGITTTFNVSVTLVGTTVYSDVLSNWRLSTTPTASYANNMITMKTTQSNADSFAMWCFDRAKTLWSAVNGKKIRVRITLASPDWVGDMSQVAPRNFVNVGLAIYKNATITAGGDRQKYTDLERLVLTSEPTTHEYIFECDISNFANGSGTPTSSSTFGLQAYDCSANTINITSAEIVEVLN